MWARVLFLSLAALLLSKSAEAKVYRCEGTNGTTILTDQPKGKHGCAVVTTPSPSPPGGFTPPVDSPSAPRPDLPLTVVPPSASSMLPRQSFSNEPSSPPATSKDSSAPAAPEAQHCSPRVNPLNPFAGLNCPPASGETKKP
ncbi:MAG: DUF4124 domain-containing protein [Nitrospira sp.]|nr:DUF4124 domain-containing protein [Nitrospira sp.]